ncbi:MAG: class I SAM-dependent methyltransferase [Novosphingobium sp.]
MPALYDTIGIDYAQLRKPDPRIAVQIERALGAARTVLNVGAGTGSYEPADRDVVALEPSAEMISQRPPGAAPAVQGSAGAIPFPDQSFDAAIGVLTIHHWADQQQGIREMCRVARERVVLLTFDPAARPWLTDYLPELATLDEAAMPSLDTLSDWLGSVAIEPVLVPHDCSDGFLYAYWRRPAAYLDPRIRKGSSSFWKIEQAEAGLARLAEDLANGVWEQRYAALLAGDSYDAGYLLVISLR